MHEAALHDAVAALVVIARELDADRLEGHEGAALLDEVLACQRDLRALKLRLAANAACEDAGAPSPRTDS